MFFFFFGFPLLLEKETLVSFSFFPFISTEGSVGNIVSLDKELKGTEYTVLQQRIKRGASSITQVKANGHFVISTIKLEKNLSFVDRGPA